MVSYELDLNTKTGDVLPRLHVSQYNKGQAVECLIYDGNSPIEIPSGATAMVNGTKPDNTGFEYSATASGSTVTFTITEQMTAVAGEVTCEVVIFKDEERVGTINFLLVVEPAALADDTVISETDLPVIQRIPEYLAEAEGYVQDAEEQAGIAELWATGGEGGQATATNNAKYWAEQAQAYAVGALHWRGNTTFANIPITDLTVGDVYNVTDDFTTDSRFNEGAGVVYGAGTNIVWGSNDKWDIQAPPSVQSFNGRKGVVVPASGDYTDELVTSSAIAGKATVKAALQGLDTDKQPKTLSTPIAGKTTVETCLTQINADLSGKINNFTAAAFLRWSGVTADTNPNTLKFYIDYGNDDKNFIRVIFTGTAISLTAFVNGVETYIWTK